MPNTWMFTTNETTIIGVMCNAEREDLQLTGSGIIKLQPGCMIKTAYQTLHSQFYLDQRIVQSFVKETVLTSDPIISKHIELKNPPPFTNIMRLLDNLEPTESSLTVTLFYTQPYTPYSKI